MEPAASEDVAMSDENHVRAILVTAMDRRAVLLRTLAVLGVTAALSACRHEGKPITSSGNDDGSEGGGGGDGSGGGSGM